MKIGKNALWISLAVASMVAVPGCNREGASVAKVNGEAISETEFHDYLETKSSFVSSLQGMQQAQAQQTLQALSQGGAGVTRVTDPPAFQALRDLVRQKVTMQLAKEEGVMPSADEVDDELRNQKELDPTFVKKLQAGLGMSMEQIRRQVQYELAQNQLLSKGITVTNADVEDFLKANPSIYTDPAEAEMLWVYVRTPEKQAEVDKALASGTKFKDVALKFSEAPGAEENGGAFGVRKISAMPAPVQQMVEKLELNSTSEWMKDDNGYAKFYLISKKAEKVNEVSDIKRKQIERDIAVQRGRQGKDMENKILRRMAEADVVIERSALKPMWTKFKEQMESEIKKMDAES